MEEYLYDEKTFWPGAIVPLVNINLKKFCSYFQTCLSLKSTTSNESWQEVHISKIMSDSYIQILRSRAFSQS